MTSQAFSETTDSTDERLVLSGAIPGAAPADVFTCFTDGERVTTWWSPQAEVTPEPGGAFVARWPEQSWTMRGTFIELEAPHRVAFTWSWDHQPDVPDRLVTVTFARHEDGTMLELVHAPFGPDEAEDRESHLHGWLHFLPELAAQFDRANT